MPEYTQAERSIRVYSRLEANALLIEGFSGVEGISQPFHFHLDLLSELSDIDPDQLLRSPILVELPVTPQDTRYIHGRVSRFAQLGKRDELYFYRAEIVPWLWFLTLSRECRMFQDLSAIDIIESIFKRLGYSDYEFRLRRSHPKRPYCVQYRESHFDFVSRLLEEEGTFYFFEHTDKKHTLVLSDDSSSSDKILGPSTLCFNTEEHPEEYVVHGLEREHRVHPGKMSLRDYDFEKPLVTLSEAEGGENEEVYDFPGGFRDADEGGRRARLLLEAEEAERQVVRGTTNASGLMPGHQFELAEHFQRGANGAYLLTQVQHKAKAGEFRGWDAGSGVQYRNEFQAIPEATPYRPRRRTPKPLIHGSQSALVVGKQGEEVWSDKHGRIKVHFYWDRESELDENSSCWIRVSTPWAGKSWGAVSIPRIGNEVLVAFEDGDPDRPVVIGSVYNANQTPPYALPANQVHSGIKSRSSKEGAPPNFNEIRLEDTKGSELLFIQAEKDKRVLVKNDRTENVGANETITIGANRNESVGEDETISVGGSRSESVAKNETVDIGKNRGHSIGGNDTLDVAKNRTVSVSENLSTTVSKNSTLAVSESWTVTVSKDHKETVGKNYSLSAKEVFIEGKDKVEIKSGSASIILKKNGDIQVKGGKINIKGSGDVVIKGSKIGEN